MQKSPCDSQTDQSDQHLPPGFTFPHLCLWVSFQDTLLSHQWGNYAHCSRCTPLSILYSSDGYPLFLKGFRTSKVFSHNKFRVKTDTILNHRFKKSHASWMEGLKKGRHLLLPLLCLPSNAGTLVSSLIRLRVMRREKACAPVLAMG